MTDMTLPQPTTSRPIQWVPELFFHPRAFFRNLSTQSRATWLTPLLLVSLFVLVNVLVAGYTKHQSALSGEITYPPDFQYYTPEQQAQYMQAIQSTQGPVFTYVLPAISALIGVWFGWLILGGVLHLVTTLMGGRGNTALSMSIVAWSSLPFALRALIQLIYILSTHQLITNPGLSGFSSTVDTAGIKVFIFLILRSIDIYIIWQFLLMTLGVRQSTSLNINKSILSVLISILIIVLLKTGASYLMSTLSNLSITRPFFF